MEKLIELELQGSDFGKLYVIQQMSAYDGFMWAFRAGLEIARNGKLQELIAKSQEKITEDEAVSTDFLSLAKYDGLSFFAMMGEEKAIELKDILFKSCVRHIPDKSKANYTVSIEPSLSHIQELDTYAYLLREAFNIHVARFTIAVLSNFA